MSRFLEMDLAYLYIKKHKSIVDREFQFSTTHRFQIMQVSDRYKLNISKIKSIVPDNFFGQQISIFTLIVGKNGSGKTTLFDFIKSELVDGNINNHSSYLAIFQDGDRFVSKHCNLEIDLELDPLGFLSKPPFLLFYSPFMDFSFENKLFTEQVGQMMNLSDSALIFDDYEKHVKKDRRSIFSSSLADSVQSHRISNDFREIDYFLHADIGEIPKSHQIAIGLTDIQEILTQDVEAHKTRLENFSEQEDYKNLSRNYNVLKLIQNIYVKGIPEVDNINKRKYFFFRHLILNLFYDCYFLYSGAKKQANLETSNSINNQNIVNSILRDLDATIASREDLLHALDKFIDLKIEDFSLNQAATSIKSFLLFDLELAFSRESRFDLKFSEIQELNQSQRLTDHLLSLDFRKYTTETKEFLLALGSIKLSTVQYYTRKLSDLKELYQYSTGELNFIKLFSRLFFAFNQLEDKKIKHALLLLDEAEIGMHPEWQQKFISWLLNFIENNLSKEISLQIILTTHSSMMLSDIPSQNAIRLQDKSTEMTSTDKTFGANLYDLLNDSFFLSKGFIGEFAGKKIDACFEILQREDGKISDYEKQFVESIIDIAGEPLIKRQLVQLYDEKFRTKKELDFIDEQIKRLQKMKENLKKDDLDSK